LKSKFEELNRVWSGRPRPLPFALYAERSLEQSEMQSAAQSKHRYKLSVFSLLDSQPSSGAEFLAIQIIEKLSSLM